MEVVVKMKTIDSAKKLVVYYSYEGNTRFIANAIAEAVGADVLELKPKKDMSSKGFMKYVWGGQKVVFKQKPELDSFDNHPEDYDIIFIGTPVWAFTFSPAIRTFLSNTSLKNKKIAVFCCHEGGMRKTLENMIKEVEGNSIIGKNDFFHPLHKDTEKNKEKAVAWAKEIIT